MNRSRRALVVALAVGWTAAAAGVPELISFQGRIVDAGGSPLGAPVDVQFRLWRGGDATTVPSAGALAYHERALVSPSPTGVFSHLIGAGTAQSDCAAGPCQLDAAALGDGVTPVWIEVTVDPDGVPGNADDDLLLPRARVGTAPFAFRVASLDGAVGGALSGTLAADRLTAREGATLGDASGGDVALEFDAAASAAALVYSAALGEFAFSARTRHELGSVVAAGRSFAIGPLADPAPGTYLRWNHLRSTGADGDGDGIADTNHAVSLCYNCAEGSSAPERPDEFRVDHLWQLVAAPQEGQRVAGESWVLAPPGQPAYEPFAFRLDTGHESGYAEPSASWTFRPSRAGAALYIDPSGKVRIGADSAPPSSALDVVGDVHATGDLLLEPGAALRVGSTRLLGDDGPSGVLVLGESQPALQLGDGDGDFSLTFDASSSPPARLDWAAAPREFRLSRRARFDNGISVLPTYGLSFGPFSNPVPNTWVRLRATTDTFADGNLDGIPDQDIVSGLCYNCSETMAGGPEISTEYSMKAQWEWTYAPQPGQRLVEHNWDFLATGRPVYRPLGFYLDVDRAGGFASPYATWTFKTDRSTAALHINQNGNVMIGGDTPQPAHRLEVLGGVHATENVQLDAEKALRFGTRAALQDNTAGDRLLVGGGYAKLQLRTGATSRIELDGTRVKLGDQSAGAGTSLVLGACSDVAAAGTVSLGDCNVVGFLGTATVNRIDSCTATTRGRVLHVLCGADATRFCDGDGARCGGGNLRLAGSASDFLCSPDDVLTLMCDGATWRQLGLSVN